MEMVDVVQVTTTLWTDLTGGGSEVDWKDGFLWDGMWMPLGRGGRLGRDIYTRV